MRRRALFLDRDGVINIDHGYVHKAQDVAFVDGIFELVGAANAAGHLVVVVTNQSGIARGYYSEAEFHALMDWMKEQFATQGARLDAVYFCPFHPDGRGHYRRDSACRKPAPGMLLQAAHDLNIDLPGSLLVGDQPSDMAAGRAAGLGTLLHLGAADPGHGLAIQHLAQVLPYLGAVGEG